MTDGAMTTTGMTDWGRKRRLTYSAASIGGALRLAAWALMRSKSYLGAYLRRQRGRLGAPKAITATAHKLARIVYALVRFGGEYVKRSEAEYTEQVRGRLERQLKRRAKELGFEVPRKQFLELLAQAKSNRADKGNGADIFLQFAEPAGALR